MEQYYLSNLYQTQILTAASLCTISLKPKKAGENNFIEALLTIRGSQIECHHLQQGKLRLLCQSELNCKVKTLLRIKNIRGKEDSLFMLSETGVVIFGHIEQGQFVQKTSFRI